MSRAAVLVALLAAALAGCGEPDPADAPPWDPARAEPDLPEVLAALRGGRPELAVQRARARLEESPAPDGVHHFLGIALLDLGRFAEAREALEQAVARHPGDVEGHLFLAEALIELGELEAAEPHLAFAAPRLPGLPFVELLRGRLAWFQGDEPGATLAYQRYLEAEPLGTRAVEAHARLAQLAASAGREDLRAAHEQRSDLLLRMHQYLEGHRARLAEDPNDADAIFGIGLVRLSMYQDVVPRPELLDEARAAFERALELEPERVRALYNLAFVAIQQDREAEAFALYERLLDLDPTHVPAALNAARLARLHGQLERARGYLEGVRQHATERADQVTLHVEAGLLAEAQGSLEEALVELRAAAALDPEDPALEAEIERIRALREG